MMEIKKRGVSLGNPRAPLWPVSTGPICARPSFLTGVVGQSQPSVGREGTNRVRWPVSKKLIFLTYVSLPFDVYVKKTV